MLLFSIFAISFVSASLLLTKTKQDFEISDKCMREKHPLIPESLDCSNSFYSTSKSFKKSIKELLTTINPQNLSTTGTIKPFPWFPIRSIES